MSRHVRSALVALTMGSVLQRIAQLLAAVVIARELGASGMGSYALGLSAATILSLLCGAGIRSVVAREAVGSPECAGDWIRAAIRLRLLGGAVLFSVYAVAAVLLTQSPWFWLLCGASVFPLAFDLKGLADSASRTPLEVVLESIASWLHLGLVAAVVFTAENNHLEWLAGAFLTSRMVYALAARTRLASFPTTGFRPSLRKMVVSAGAVSVTQTVFETLCHCDVLVITVLAGTEIAGLYAVALRIFVAVSFPAVQLARLLVPHLNHSARSGDEAGETGSDSVADRGEFAVAPSLHVTAMDTDVPSLSGTKSLLTSNVPIGAGVGEGVGVGVGVDEGVGLAVGVAAPPYCSLLIQVPHRWAPSFFAYVPATQTTDGSDGSRAAPE